MRRLYRDDGTMDWVDQSVLSDETGLKCEDKSLAIQSARDECDINVIVERFGLTGTMPVGLKVPTYEDFINAPEDYRGALEAVERAKDAFNRLPAAVRVRFNHDPGEFVEFCSDEKNYEEAKKFGLVLDKTQDGVIIAPKSESGSPA